MASKLEYLDKPVRTTHGIETITQEELTLLYKLRYIDNDCKNKRNKQARTLTPEERQTKTAIQRKKNRIKYATDRQKLTEEDFERKLQNIERCHKLLSKYWNDRLSKDAKLKFAKQIKRKKEIQSAVEAYRKITGGRP